ncbi:MAG: hypothetical protein IPI49_11195 [Myxococcales bacterium]|nr:hypothetical protein [Myxococcales bacterium]
MTSGAGPALAAVATPVTPAVQQERGQHEPRHEGRVRFVVEWASGAKAARPAWQQRALAAVLPGDLDEAGGAALRLVRAEALAQCAARGCGAPELRAASVDVVVRCQLVEAGLQYELWWVDADPSPVTDALHLDGQGVVALSAPDRLALGQALADAVTQARRQQTAALAAAARAPAAVAAPKRSLLLVAWLVLAALWSLPLALAVIIGLPLGRALRLHSQRVTAVCLIVAGLGALALAGAGDAVTRTPVTVFLAGGLAWGTLLVVLVPIALPPILGFSRVQVGELALVLRAWVGAALRRQVALALLAAAVAWLVGTADAAAGLSPALSFGVVLPLGALALWHAGRASVAVLAARLDDNIVDGPASAEQPWHPAVAGYVRGYLRRAGLAEPAFERLLERVWFVPGKRAGIAVYGGGLTPSRVVISRAELERALAPYDRPHDYVAPRISTLQWMQWNAGLIVPSEIGSVVAARSQRQPRDFTVEGEADRQMLGEPVTLAGVVEPARLDARPRARVHEDTDWLAWDPGDEHDGTDASDKDWLFGALVAALGVVHRREDRVRSLRLWWGERRRAPKGGVAGEVAAVAGEVAAVAVQQAAPLADAPLALVAPAAAATAAVATDAANATDAGRAESPAEGDVATAAAAAEPDAAAAEPDAAAGEPAGSTAPDQAAVAASEEPASAARSSTAESAEPVAPAEPAPAELAAPAEPAPAELAAPAEPAPAGACRARGACTCGACRARGACTCGVSRASGACTCGVSRARGACTCGVSRARGACTARGRCGGAAGRARGREAGGERRRRRGRVLRSGSWHRARS